MKRSHALIRPYETAMLIPLAAIRRVLLAAGLAGLFATSSPSCLAETGVFIFNQTLSHPESSASAMRYISVISRPPLTLFTLENGQQVTVLPSQPLLVLPDISIRAIALIRPADAAGYIQNLKEYKAAYNKYPNSRQLLKWQVSDLQEAVTKLQSGQAWFEGEWVDDAEVDRVRSRRIEEADKKKKMINQTAQLALVETRIRAVQQELDSLKSKVKEASDRSERITANHKKAVEEVNDTARTFLIQLAPR